MLISAFKGLSSHLKTSFAPDDGKMQMKGKVIRFAKRHDFKRE